MNALKFNWSNSTGSRRLCEFRLLYIDRQIVPSVSSTTVSRFVCGSEGSTSDSCSFWFLKWRAQTQHLHKPSILDLTTHKIVCHHGTCTHRACFSFPACSSCNLFLAALSTLSLFISYNLFKTVQHIQVQ